jgi:beta-ureidopropionase
VLFGANQGKPVAALDLPKGLQELAEEQAFDLQAYKFGAAAEQFRAPRLVKVGLIQNAVVKPTTAPFAEQRQVSSMGTEMGMFLAAAFNSACLTALYHKQRASVQLT